MRISWKRGNYGKKHRTNPEESLIYKIQVIYFQAFCYKWVTNLNLSFLLVKAMIGTQFVTQFCAHKKQTNMPIAPGRHS